MGGNVNQLPCMCQQETLLLDVVSNLALFDSGLLCMPCISYIQTRFKAV